MFNYERWMQSILNSLQYVTSNVNSPYIEELILVAYEEVMIRTNQNVIWSRFNCQGSSASSTYNVYNEDFSDTTRSNSDVLTKEILYIEDSLGNKIENYEDSRLGLIVNSEATHIYVAQRIIYRMEDCPHDVLFKSREAIINYVAMQTLGGVETSDGVNKLSMYTNKYESAIERIQASVPEHIWDRRYTCTDSHIGAYNEC